MREKLKKRLRSQAGETIAEVLISLLIAALSLVMLATMISATVNMVNTSKEKMISYYDANVALEEQPSTSGVSASVSIQTNSTGTSATQVNEPVGSVSLYTNDVFEKNHVYSYHK